MITRQYLGARAYPLYPKIRDRTDKETFYRCINELTNALEDLMPKLEDDRRWEELVMHMVMIKLSGHGY